MDDEVSKDLVQRWIEGDSQAAEEIYERYQARLMSLAHCNLIDRLRSKIEPEDAVISAYRSFFRRSRNGDFVFERAGDLWRLLAQITLNKLKKKVTFYSAAKRDATREHPLLDSDVSLSEPSAEEVAEVLDSLDNLIKSIPEEWQRMIQMRLAGDTIEDIANDLNVTQRTIRRWLEEVRKRLEQAK